jgi:HEAT repeat protein
MLKPEEAQKEFAKLQREDWVEARLSSLARLPATARTLGHALLGHDADGAARQWQRLQEERRQAAARLEKETPAMRRRLFAVLFPKLGDSVEAAWQLIGRLPYQTGHARKAYRISGRQYVANRAANLLEGLSGGVSSFEQDITWWAAWAGHDTKYGIAETMGILFAATIDAGGAVGDEVFETLCASCKNEHAIGVMGRHVTRALLASGRVEGWELMEKTLLAAQRQEGLRQTILEAVDEAHPGAFRRMLCVILEHDLARFSAVVRAVDVWFGFQWDSVSTGVVNKAIEQALLFLDDEASRAKAIQKGEGDDLHLALWAIAFEDADRAVPTASPLLTDKNVKRRFIAAHLLTQLRLPSAQKQLVRALDDEDLRVAWIALSGMQSYGFDDDSDEEEEAPAIGANDLFERLEKLLQRLPPKGTSLKPLVWPWMVFKVHPVNVHGFLAGSLGNRPPTLLIPHLKKMSGWDKTNVINLLAKQKKWDGQTRATLFALVGDSSAGVREQAVKALVKCKVEESDAVGLEALLMRKAQDLRRGVLSLLLQQKDAAAFASAERLLTAKDPSQRLAGLEILRELATAKRQPDKCRDRAAQFRKDRPRLTPEEEKSLAAIAEAADEKPTIDNALGLLDPAELTKPVAPKKRCDVRFTPAAVALLESLDALIHEHREDSVVLKARPTEQDPEEIYNPYAREPELSETPAEPKPVLLGQLHYGFPWPDAKFSADEDLKYLPLAEIWQKWWNNRPKETRDKDGCEVLRALALHQRVEDESSGYRPYAAEKTAFAALFGDRRCRKLNYLQITEMVLVWLLRLHPPKDAVDFLLDVIETSFALVPAEELAKVRTADQRNRWSADYVSDWRDGGSFLLWYQITRVHRIYCAHQWTPQQHVRMFRLQNWKDRSVPGVGRFRPAFQEILDAYRAGGATRADLLDAILGPPDAVSYASHEFPHLSELTDRRPRTTWVADFPELCELANLCRERILQIELARGDTETAASSSALSISSVWGIDTLVRILQALGSERFHRGYSYRNNLGKGCVLTHLAASCYPKEGETAEQFAQKMRAASVPDDRLIELAFKAPQWVEFVEHTLGWAGFSEGVWWFLAHTRDSGQPFDKVWMARLAERTALTPRDLLSGAVDVAWFHRAYAAVGAKRWPALDDAAKFASMGGGYRRAQFLASVLLGKAKRNALIADIQKKHLKETVRALGLLPLAAGAERDKDLAQRYKVLQDYHRYARGLSAMSREDAVRSAEVGIANLSRTAGYPDPIRFQWAMEAASCADLLHGLTIKAGPVTASLKVDAEGQLEWRMMREGKPLKSIPPAQKNDKKLAELVERKKDLIRSQSRMRRGLEDMMCRGDTFTGAELVQLAQHPLLAPMLGRWSSSATGSLAIPRRRARPCVTMPANSSR